SGTKTSDASATKRKSHKTGSAGGKKRSARMVKIKPISAMKMSQFKKLPKEVFTESIIRWVWKHRVKTPCGQFGVELSTEEDDSIDETMVRLAVELAQYAQMHTEYIREIIYGHYHYYVTECGPDSLFSDMPADLPPGRIWKYCHPVLHVTRKPKDY